MAHLSPVVSLTQDVLLLVFICWTPSSTGAAFSLEEEFLQLKENYVRIYQNLFSTRGFCCQQSYSIVFNLLFLCLILINILILFNLLLIDSNETSREKLGSQS
jgi:hypothetical protein